MALPIVFPDGQPRDLKACCQPANVRRSPETPSRLTRHLHVICWREYKRTLIQHRWSSLLIPLNIGVQNLDFMVKFVWPFWEVKYTYPPGGQRYHIHLDNIWLNIAVSHNHGGDANDARTNHHNDVCPSARIQMFRGRMIWMLSLELLSRWCSTSILEEEQWTEMNKWQ